MKNKIILTSIVAIMATCPVWADPWTPGSSANCYGDPIDNINDGSVTYTASWTNCSATVAYDCGTESGCDLASQSSPLTTGTSFTLANAATVTGHTFREWECNYSLTTGLPASNGATYNAEQTIASPVSPCPEEGTSTNRTITCTAMWNTDSYKITYEPGTPAQTTVTGMPSPLIQPVSYGTAFTLASAPAANGYDFNGWDCPNLATMDANQTVSGTNYYRGNATGRYTITSNVTCTAQWTPKTITLTWELDGGNLSTSNAPSCKFGTDAPAANSINPINKPTKAGYTFAGWAIEATQEAL